MKRKPGQKASAFAEKGMRLVRSWETIMLLAESNKPLSSREINDKVHKGTTFNLPGFKCSIQTTNEDLKTLLKCKFPICRVDKDHNEINIDEFESVAGKFKNTKWSLREPSKLRLSKDGALGMPTSADIISLSLCRTLLDNGISNHFYFRKYLSKLLEELQLQLNKKLRLGDEGTDLHDKILHIGRQYVGKSVPNEIWSRISFAVARKQVLVGKYENRSGKKRDVDVAPLAIWFSDGRSYTLAAGATDKKIRAWRMDRFSDLRVVPDRKPPEVSEKVIEDALRTSFKGYISDPVKIHLEVRPEAAYLFREFEYHPSQEVNENENGSLDVYYECATGWGFEEWVLGFGELIIVKSPEQLRERLRYRIKKLQCLYCDDA
jgi:predicted DNA-binding transcriptional regulator YafY